MTENYKVGYSVDALDDLVYKEAVDKGVIIMTFETERLIIRPWNEDDETYAVCLKEDNRAIGSIGLIKPAQSHTKVGDDEIEVGYWIGVPFWGKGLIPEAVRKIQEHAFLDLGCTAMWCGYYDGNEKSKRCQEKCGFVYHHTEENKTCVLMGDNRTEHFTKLTKEAWEYNIEVTNGERKYDRESDGKI